MCTSANNTETVTVHPWEMAGHGKAPFRCVGMAAIPSASLAEQNPMAYQNAMNALPRGYGVGSCGVCGTPLVNNFLIHSADSRKFAVGCDCVAKVGDTKVMRKVDLIKKQVAKAKRADAAEAKRMVREARIAAEQFSAEIEGWGMCRREAAAIVSEAYLDFRADALAGVAATLMGQRGNFCQSVGRDMLAFGRVPTGRGLTITLEIMGKVAGRKGSKGYAAAYDAAAALFESLDW